METRYCLCGTPVLIDSRWNGLAHVILFFDETGQEINECPGCGEAVRAWLHIREGEETLSLKPGALLYEPPEKASL
jgi:hypothetical protein